MPHQTLQLWFKALQFQITPGEDAETNPLCYGKQLSEWLHRKLLSANFPTAEVIPEDWGWCVMCQRKPFSLWVGCTNVHNPGASRPGDPTPQGKDLVWSCIVVAEQPLLGRLFGGRDTNAMAAALFQQVQHALAAEPDVQFTSKP